MFVPIWIFWAIGILVVTPFLLWAGFFLLMFAIARSGQARQREPLKAVSSPSGPVMRISRRDWPAGD